MRIATSQIYEHNSSRLMSLQERVIKLNQMISSENRVSTPSDDPIAAAQIELMSQRINSTLLLQKNRQAAESSLTLQDGILGDTSSSLQRLREIQLQAGNSALSESDRKALATEAKVLLNQMQDLANTRDSAGNFMFSGGQSGTQAISINSAGQYIYAGDSTQRFQGVTGSLQIAISDTGDNVFMRIPNGNGKFTINNTATPNTGTAAVSSGSVVNAGAYVPDNYTMSFASNSSGQTVVMVSGVSSGNVIPPTGLVDDAPLYHENEAITFNGMSMTVTGAPMAGDSFSIAPSQNESVFSTVQRMIANLGKPYGSAEEKAATQTENNQLLDQLDSALTNILDVRADVGARLNQLTSAYNTNISLIDASVEAMASLQKIDSYAVASEYALQVLNLQVAQQSFARIQGLSLFNYI